MKIKPHIKDAMEPTIVGLLLNMNPWQLEYKFNSRIPIQYT
jgi:hypothetical protein